MRRLLALIQNLIFWPLFFAASFIYISIGSIFVLAIGLTTPKRFTLRMIRRAITWYGRTVIACGWPFVRVKYHDFRPEEKSPPYIIVCNHRSTSDPFLLACLPFEAIQVAKGWALNLPVLGWVAKLAGYLTFQEISVDKFFEECARLIEEKVCIISFPEGTRSGSREMGQFTSAVFRMALQTKADIVPLAIAGSENIPLKGRLVLHPGLIRVEKLPAVKWEEYRNMDVFKLKNHVRNILDTHLKSIEGDNNIERNES